MNFDDLPGIDWDAIDSTADWTRLLDDLLALARSAGTAEQREILADTFDAFADRSTSDDLALVTRLDGVARKSARALRKQDIAASVAALAAASSEFQTIAREFGAVSAALKQQASQLRAEKFTAAVTSLTQTIASLESLSQAVATDGDDALAAAIADALLGAQRLRALIDKPA
jgi:hypothetical protein